MVYSPYFVFLVIIRRWATYLMGWDYKYLVDTFNIGSMMFHAMIVILIHSKYWNGKYSQFMA